MANWKFEGLTEYIKQLEDIGQSTTGMVKRAVYDGAAVVGAEIASAIQTLPENDGKFVPNGNPIVGVTREQKAGLLEGFGFAKMQDEGGYINTKAGFDGYNGERTKRYPNGQPNALIANAVNSGTSRRPKTSFINKAVNAAKGKAEAAMAARFDEDMKNLIKE